MATDSNHELDATTAQQNGTTADACHACGAPDASPLNRPLNRDGRCEDCAEPCPCCGDYRADCACEISGPTYGEQCRETGYVPYGSFCDTHQHGWED